MSLLSYASERLFQAVHGRNLIYNTCWEDPRLDRAALELTSADRVLVITSAGCNALDYVLAGAGEVVAVDINPRQNSLLELKIAAIRALSFDEFFQMFGAGCWPDFAGAYPRRIRPLLSPSAAAYWDRHSDFFLGGARRSFYFHGTTGWVAWLMNAYLDRVARIRDAIEAMLSARSVTEQAAIYDQEVQKYLWHRPLRWTLRRESTMSLLGVPRPQKEQIDRDYAGGMPQFVEDCIRTVFGKLSLADNYFWRVYLTGGYTPGCCPEYLKRSNFLALKAGLVNRVSVHNDSVSGYLETHDGRFSRFVLLDHQDWLSHQQGGKELAREWKAITRRAAETTRILWRSAGLTSEFVDRTELLDDGGSRYRLGERLAYRRSLAAQLHPQDRVHTYGSLHIADLIG